MAKNDMYVSYKTIKMSKAGRAFYAEYLPQDSVIKIGEKNFDIKEAWVEHPHLQKHFSDEISTNFICVLSISMSQNDFNEAEWRKMNVHHYIKEDGFSNSEIWFYLTEPKENIKDTIVVHYRYPSNSYEQKGFMLFKKK